MAMKRMVCRGITFMKRFYDEGRHFIRKWGALRRSNIIKSMLKKSHVIASLNVNYEIQDSSLYILQLLNPWRKGTRTSHRTVERESYIITESVRMKLQKGENLHGRIIKTS